MARTAEEAFARMQAFGVGKSGSLIGHRDSTSSCVRCPSTAMAEEGGEYSIGIVDDLAQRLFDQHGIDVDKRANWGRKTSSFRPWSRARRRSMRGIDDIGHFRPFEVGPTPSLEMRVASSRFWMS